MSLAVAIVTHNSGVLASDGLAWKDGKIVSEDATKQIRLGDNIAISSCGLVDNTAKLFSLCRGAYDEALWHGFDPLDSVKASLRVFHGALPAPSDPLQSRSTALLLARLPNGRMYAAHIGAGNSIQEYCPAPGDSPVLMFLIPTPEVRSFLVQTLVPKVFFYHGEQAEFIQSIKQGLPAFYAEAAKVHEPRRCNCNLTMTVFDHSGSTFIPQSTQTMPAELRGADCDSIAASAVNSQVTQETTSYVDVTGGASPSQIATATITPGGGYVKVKLYTQIASTNSAAAGYDLSLYRGDSTGTLLADFAYGTFISAGDGKFLSVALEGLDATPGITSVTYSAYCNTNSGGTVSLIPVILICENAKV